MALERSRSGGGAREIARFLHDHQACDSGFEVSREPGSAGGRLGIVCKGCGEAISYRAAEAGELAAGPRPENGVPPEPDPGPPAAGSRGSPPRWLPSALIVALIAAGSALIAIGVLRSGEQRGASPEAGTAPASTGTEPVASAPADPEPPARTTPSQQGQSPAGAGQQRGEDPGTRLSRRRFRSFAIGVPPGWRLGRGDAVIVAAPGDVAAVRVYFEAGEEPLGRVADGAARFLLGEHEGARVSAARPRLLAGRRGRELTATYAGGAEEAIVLAAKGNTYLVLVRVDRGASAPIAAQASAVAQSFAPR